MNQCVKFFDEYDDIKGTNYPLKTILLTGSNGFVGTYFMSTVKVYGEETELLFLEPRLESWL